MSARKPYEVEFTYRVCVWAEDEESAFAEASLYGRDEAGLGEAFDQLSHYDDCVTEMEPEHVYPREFINEEDDR